MILSQDMVFYPLLTPCIFIKGKFCPPYINKKVLYKEHRRVAAFFIICNVASLEVGLILEENASNQLTLSGILNQKLNQNKKLNQNPNVYIFGSHPTSKLF